MSITQTLLDELGTLALDELQAIERVVKDLIQQRSPTPDVVKAAEIAADDAADAIDRAKFGG